ncbi:hypothetical protein [Kitasatospora sp. NPDC005856]
MSALLLAVLFVGWLVWLVNIQPSELRAAKRELAAGHSASGDRK